MYFSNFILKEILPFKKVLMAISGGPDSLALLHAAIPLKRDFEMGVVHVDHGWRKESRQEALHLKRLSEDLGFPFYLKVLDLNGFKGNLELKSREERYRFFEEICQKYGYEVVLLAHHRDDQAETILKRILEGASLPALSGMKKNNRRFIRPFLDFTKEELIKSLKGAFYFEDPTNQDVKFLRAKMRQEILPYLEAEFGKKITKPLVRFGLEMQELSEGMKKKYEKWIFQDELDLSEVEYDYERRFIIREWLKKKGGCPSFAVLDEIMKALERPGKKRKWIVEGATVEIKGVHLKIMGL